MPGFSGVTCGDYTRVLRLLSYARLRVHRAPGIPCALCLRASDKRIPRANDMRRDRGSMSQRHCERSEAIHVSACGAMDCFASLAITTSIVVTRESE